MSHKIRILLIRNAGLVKGTALGPGSRGFGLGLSGLGLCLVQMISGGSVGFPRP